MGEKTLISVNGIYQKVRFAKSESSRLKPVLSRQIKVRDSRIGLKTSFTVEIGELAQKKAIEWDVKSYSVK